eukprot:139856-Prorocentrum_minimum.AAC.8
MGWRWTIEAHPEQFNVSLQGGKVQWGMAVGVGNVHVRPPGHQIHHHLQPVISHSATCISLKGATYEGSFCPRGL